MNPPRSCQKTTTRHNRSLPSRTVRKPPTPISSIRSRVTSRTASTRRTGTSIRRAVTRQSGVLRQVSMTAGMPSTRSKVGNSSPANRAGWEILPSRAGTRTSTPSKAGTRTNTPSKTGISSPASKAGWEIFPSRDGTPTSTPSKTGNSSPVRKAGKANPPNRHGPLINTANRDGRSPKTSRGGTSSRIRTPFRIRRAGIPIKTSKAGRALSQRETGMAHIPRNSNSWATVNRPPSTCLTGPQDWRVRLPLIAQTLMSR